MYDIIIIGGGPAGLTAAIYALRAGKKTLVIEKGTFGGQITFSPKVENIPGFTSVTGNEFAEKLVDQALFQGADFEACEVLSVSDGKTKTVKTDGGDFEAKAVIVATGAAHRLLGLENEEKFIGEGISFCAVCDGAFYKDKTVGVVGGGNSALQEAILLSGVAKKVIIIQNLPYLTGEKKLCEEVEKSENIEILTETTVKKLLGEKELSGVVTEKNGEEKEIALDGLFVAIGLVPQNAPFESVLSLDERGYADSSDCKTKTDGVFVAGDCRTKKIRQVSTAASDGAIAALAACDYIDRF